MLITEKDYCDYDTAWALCSLGYPEEDLILLYSAQKWLREIHNIFVMIDRSFAASNSWHYVICANDDFEHLIEQSSLENYSYEEALSEGVRASIEILKEE